ncbi:hypothetical protein VTN77DRAFT_8062 [Rasamsonia byssochlamydoides]|uniref:uncharacterized protein n=1 Tax=Rasamsonia byssochlamydoides TaxID=89139 RepID=UPI0037444627
MPPRLRPLQLAPHRHYSVRTPYFIQLLLETSVNLEALRRHQRVLVVSETGSRMSFLHVDFISDPTSTAKLDFY